MQNEPRKEAGICITGIGSCLALSLGLAGLLSVSLAVPSWGQGKWITIQVTRFLKTKNGRIDYSDQIDIDSLTTRGFMVLAKGRETEVAVDLNVSRIVGSPTWIADCQNKEIAWDPGAKPNQGPYSVQYIGNNRWKRWGTNTIYGEPPEESRRRSLERGVRKEFLDKLDAYMKQRQKTHPVDVQHKHNVVLTNVFTMLCGKSPDTRLRSNKSLEV